MTTNVESKGEKHFAYSIKWMVTTLGKNTILLTINVRVGLCKNMCPTRHLHIIPGVSKKVSVFNYIYQKN